MFGWFKKVERSELFMLVEESTKDLSKWEVVDASLWSPSVRYLGNETPILWEMERELDSSSIEWEYPITSPCCLQADEALALGNILFYSVWQPCVRRDRVARLEAKTAFRNQVARDMYDRVLALYKKE